MRKAYDLRVGTSDYTKDPEPVYIDMYKTGDGDVIITIDDMDVLRITEEEGMVQFKRIGFDPSLVTPFVFTQWSAKYNPDSVLDIR